MDYDSGRCAAKGASSVNQGDEMFCNRIISRNSSVGYSSRIYYYRSSEGIPFNWEMQPGTPKEPQKEDILPPISPPPAVLSLGLPKPCINIEEPKPRIKFLRFQFWKQWKKSHWVWVDGKKRLHQAAAGGSKGDIINILNVIDHQSDKYSNYETCSSDDGDFMSCSSSSSSMFFSNGNSFGSSRISSLSRKTSLHREHYGCSPLNFSKILVRVSNSRSSRLGY